MALSTTALIALTSMSNPSPLLILLDIASTPPLYLVRNTDDITYKDILYTAFPFELSAIAENAKGEIPQFTIRVSNVSQLLQPMLEANNGLVGVSVTIHLVASDALTEDFSDLDRRFEIISTSSDAQNVTFTLGVPNPFRSRFPRDRYVASFCAWEDNSAECNRPLQLNGTYTIGAGANIALASDATLLQQEIQDGQKVIIAGEEMTVQAVTTDPTTNLPAVLFYNTHTAGATNAVATFPPCGRTLQECRFRLNSSRFGGFPGLAKGGLRIV